MKDDTGGPWITGNPFDRSVEGFRTRHGSAKGPMSRAHYAKLKKLKIAPRETVLGDGVVIITVADEAAWEEARANPTGKEAARVAEVRKRWRERALAAGAKAAESPIHVSKLKLGRSKRPPQSKQRKGK